MERSFNSLNIDPLIGTELISLFGMKEYEVNDPKKYSQLRSILDYYKGRDDVRHEVLKVISKRPMMDKLDAVWTYVELQKEKQSKLKALDPEDFEPDIEAQLKQGVLTKENMKRIKRDVVVKREKIKKDTEHEKKVGKAVGKVFDEMKLNNVVDTLEQIEIINGALEHYG